MYLFTLTAYLLKLITSSKLIGQIVHVGELAEIMMQNIWLISSMVFLSLDYTGGVSAEFKQLDCLISQITLEWKAWQGLHSGDKSTKHWWLSERLQYLQCISNGDTLHSLAQSHDILDLNSVTNVPAKTQNPWNLTHWPLGDFNKISEKYFSS